MKNISKEKNVRAFSFFLFCMRYLFGLDIPINSLNISSMYNETELSNLLKMVTSSACVKSWEAINNKNIYIALRDTYKNEIIPEDNFLWFKNNERALYFVWGSIRINHSKLIQNAMEKVTQESNGQYKNINIKQFNFDNSIFFNIPHDLNDMYSQIVNFFDFFIWSFSIADPEINNFDVNNSNTVDRYVEKHTLNSLVKKHILDSLKTGFSHINLNKKVFSWLDKKNKVMLDWCFEYIMKTKNKYIGHGDIISNNVKPFENINNISTKFEVGFMNYNLPIIFGKEYNTIYAFYDLWDAPTDTKRMFLLEINKAWNQQKNRLSRKDKISINSVIKKSTKNKLDSLAKYHDKKINEMITMLIDKEFDLIEVKKNI